MLLPLAAAALVLAAALAAYVMVKFFGIVFLGRRARRTSPYAQDAGHWERAGTRLRSPPAASCSASSR